MLSSQMREEGLRISSSSKPWLAHVVIMSLQFVTEWWLEIVVVDPNGSLALWWGQSGPLCFTVRATTARGSFTWCRHKYKLLGRTIDPDREASDQEASGSWCFSQASTR
ncbi:hypothetical protein MTO96_038683 [Rhipicephalus appendiculatus]